MIVKRKLTKKVWYEDELWDVVQLLQPTAFDDFLLLSRKDKGHIHKDSKTAPVDMILVDCNNDEFYPNTKAVERSMKRVLKARSDLEDKLDNEKDVLQSSWLNSFGSKGDN